MSWLALLSWFKSFPHNIEIIVISRGRPTFASFIEAWFPNIPYIFHATFSLKNDAWREGMDMVWWQREETDKLYTIGKLDVSSIFCFLNNYVLQWFCKMNKFKHYLLTNSILWINSGKADKGERKGQWALVRTSLSGAEHSFLRCWPWLIRQFRVL